MSSLILILGFEGALRRGMPSFNEGFVNSGWVVGGEIALIRGGNRTGLRGADGSGVAMGRGAIEEPADDR
jgi:hypothetical protein